MNNYYAIGKAIRLIEVKSSVPADREELVKNPFDYLITFLFTSNLNLADVDVEPIMAEIIGKEEEIKKSYTEQDKLEVLKGYMSKVEITQFNLKSYLEIHKITQTKLADALGVKRATVSNWANNRYNMPDDQKAKMKEIFGE